MRARRERMAALAALGAASGLAFPPGRGAVLFFAQMKSAAWPGIAVAAGAFFAIAMAALSESARLGGQRPEPVDFAGWSRQALRCLLAALAAAVMLARAGELGAVALPVQRGYLFGAGIALFTALALALSGPEAAGGAGALMAGLALMTALGCLLDSRPVRLRFIGEVELKLAGSLPWAVAMGITFAAMSGGCAAWTLERFRGCRPTGAAARATAGLCAVLVASNAAILRHGDALLAQREPWVLLTARWGKAGFWLCAALGWMGAVCTLSAAAGALLSSLRAGGRRRGTALFALICGCVVFAALSWGR